MADMKKFYGDLIVINLLPQELIQLVFFGPFPNEFEEVIVIFVILIVAFNGTSKRALIPFYSTL